MRIPADMTLCIPYDGEIAQWAETAFRVGPGAKPLLIAGRDFIVVSLDTNNDEATVSRIGFDPNSILVVGLAMVARP